MCEKLTRGENYMEKRLFFYTLHTFLEKLMKQIYLEKPFSYFKKTPKAWG